MRLRPISRPWSQAKPGDLLAVVEDYSSLLLALRRRKEAVGYTMEGLDDAAGLTAGHASKLFGPGRAKTFGILSLGLVLGALRLKLAIIADEPPVPVHRKVFSQDRSKQRFDEISKAA